MPALQLRALQTTWMPTQEKRLPVMPSSPTLTNPDMVLPDTLPTVSSPPPQPRRPPSPSYLRGEGDGEVSRSQAPGARKEKLGLMSRKMMLLRTRTASNQDTSRTMPRSAPAQVQGEQDTFLSSSPILKASVPFGGPDPMDFLQPPKAKRSSLSGSSNSDTSGLTAFLAKYEKLGGGGGASDEEAYDSEAPVIERPQTSHHIETDVDAERKRQQEEEYNSAILSERAEQILANAKKRLNVMEGNLRGARDLLPLTAANLKRATSLGSANHYSSSYSRSQYLSYAYSLDNDAPSPQRKLQSQASSPTMGRDFGNHARGLSDLPDRPHTSFEHPPTRMPRDVRQVSKTPEPRLRSLHSTRSYDSLGSSGPARVQRDRNARDSPDSSYLEPLHEADENRRSYHVNGSEYSTQSGEGMGFHRPSSRTSSIREQMSTLKGRISSLKERAREDSLRRQSLLDLRASPFNDAKEDPPEFYYSSSGTTSKAGSPTRDENAGESWFSEHDHDNDSGHRRPATQPTTQKGNPGILGREPLPGSRNAFAERSAVQMAQDQQAQSAVASAFSLDSKYRVRQSPEVDDAPYENLSSSGSSSVESAKRQYVSRALSRTQTMPGAFIDDTTFLNMPMPDNSIDHIDSSPHSSDESLDETSDEKDEGRYAPSEDEASIYEDARNQQQTPVVAHEDRADAFDYETFFLHSAMARYQSDQRESDSESETSASSVETARGPRAIEESDGDEDTFDYESELFPPPTPETPEKLKEIERNLHQRTQSIESLATVDSFATAVEGAASPVHAPATRSLGDRVIAAAVEHRAASRPSSRPSTAVKRGTVRSSSSSDRADSGVGMSQRSNSSMDARRQRTATISQRSRHTYKGSSAVTTPPMSPRLPPLQDAAIVAVNALLDPDGKQLGLRSKAVLFSVMESLRKVALRLQAEDEAHFESRSLRRRLDDAKNVLDGLL